MAKVILSLLVFFTFLPVHAQFIELLPGGSNFSKDFSLGKSKANELVINFKIGGIQLQNKDVPTPYKFQQLKFKEMELSDEVYRPELPYHSILLQGVPQDFQISYQLGAKNELATLPYPVQPHKFRCQDCPTPPFTVDWQQYFASQESYYRLEYLGTFRGIPVTKASFIPARMEEKGLAVFPQAAFRIKNNEETPPIQLDIDQILKKAQFNNRYLIVTPKNLKDSLTNLVNWKTQLGYAVDVVTLEEAGADAQALTRFFHERYANPETRFTYALLVGHEKNMPTNLRPTESSERTPTDLPYFTMDGEQDTIADVFYGRLVADTAADVANQTQKIMEYEKGGLENGFGQELALASSEGEDPSDEEYVTTMAKTLSGSFNTQVHYFLERNDDSRPENINPLLSQGVSWINYIGHGSGTGWVSQTKEYKSTDVKKISPASVKPVIIDVSCQNGRFQYGTKRLGERFMNEVSTDAKPIGAVAYYGATVNTSWTPPAIMAVGINKVLVEKKLSFLGAALLAGQLYLANHHSTLSEVQDNFTWYHLLGDPSVAIRLGAQKKLQVKESSDGLQVLDMNDQPLANIPVNLFEGKAAVQKVLTDTEGKISYSNAPKKISILYPPYLYWEK